MIELISLGEEKAPDPAYAEVVGNFTLRNASAEEICVMRDIVINETSPHLLVSETGEKESGGIGWPTKTTEILVLAPGSSMEFKRTLLFFDTRHSRRTMAKVHVSTSGWRCSTGERMTIASRPFVTRWARKR